MKTFWLKHKAEIGWLSGVAVIVMLGFWWVPGDRGTTDDTLSVNANGKKAFYLATQKLLDGDYAVSRSTESLIPPDGADTLIMLGPARYPDDAEWQQLYEWVRSGNTLLFAAKHGDPAVTSTDFGFKIIPNAFDEANSNPFGVKPKTGKAGKTKSKTGTSRSVNSETADSESEASESEASTIAKSTTGDYGDDEDDIASLFEERVATTELIPGTTYWRSDAWIEATDDRDTTILVTQDGRAQAIVRTIGYGQIVVTSSDYVFCNLASMKSSHRKLAWRLFEQGQTDGPVYFEESLNASGAPAVFGILFNSRLRPFTLQLLLATVLFGWWGSRRFGPVVEHDDATRRNIREHATALGQMHYRIKAGPHAVKQYFDLFKSDMRLTTTNPAQHAAILATRSGQSETEMESLLNRVIFAMEYHGRLPNAEAAGLLRSLATVRARINRRAQEEKNKRLPKSKRSSTDKSTRKSTT